MPETTPWGQCLTVTEASEYCKYSQLTFRCMYEHEWKVPFIRVGGKPLFIKEELDKWLAGRPERRKIDPRFLKQEEAV